MRSHVFSSSSSSVPIDSVQYLLALFRVLLDSLCHVYVTRGIPKISKSSAFESRDINDPTTYQSQDAFLIIDLHLSPTLPLNSRFKPSIFHPDQSHQPVSPGENWQNYTAMPGDAPDSLVMHPGV